MLDKSRGYRDKFIFKLLFAKKRPRTMLLHSCRSSAAWPHCDGLGETSRQCPELECGRETQPDGSRKASSSSLARVPLPAWDDTAAALPCGKRTFPPERPAELDSGNEEIRTCPT